MRDEVVSEGLVQRGGNRGVRIRPQSIDVCMVVEVVASAVRSAKKPVYSNL